LVVAAVWPNVLLVLADDVGWFDVGGYHRGIMGAATPSIDRVAAEGVLLTDAYAQASCPAGRAAFITGQLLMRTGLTTVGMPGAPQGIQPEDPTLAELLKPQGDVTAQHGKHHLGDRNQFLPTVHGFEEFYGNLYHRNAEEEPEQPDYPRDNPIVQRLFAPGGVLDCRAGEVDDPTEDERFGRVGRQSITDTGPLTRKGMETIEDDLLARSLCFMERAHQAGRPFLLWHNTTRMHGGTHLWERWRDKTGLGRYADGMQELDWVVGELLAKLEELGIADTTVVIFASDNGAEKFTWPDGGTSPFRGEKGLGWKGGFRAHLDGYNQLPYLSGETGESPRHEFFSYGEHERYAIRYNNWKVHFQTKDDWFGGRRSNPPCPAPSTSAPTPSSSTWTPPPPPVRRRKALDRPARGRHRPTAPGHLPPVPTTPGTSRVQPPRTGQGSPPHRAQRQGN
jgi:arylsulfatase